MSSELSRSSSPRWIGAAVALVLAIVVATLALGCVGPDAFNRNAGNDGIAGQTGSGGSGLGGAAMGGHTGAGGSGVGGATGGVGGKTGTGGSGMGGTLGAGGSSAGGRTGGGGSGMGGAPGVGGRGTGGAIGTGGVLANDAGSDGNDAGAGGAMGTGGAGGGTVVFSDNFESYTIGMQPPTWTHLGGSTGDYQVVLDGTQVLAQNRTATGTTYRSCYASGAPGAPWSGPTTISAQVKVTATGTTPTALLCVRYTAGNAGYCLALLPNMGAQIQIRAADVASSSSPVTAMNIAVGTQYSVLISVDSTGVLSGSVNGTAVGPFTPPGTAITSGFIGVATQMAEATFDNVVVTQP